MQDLRVTKQVHASFMVRVRSIVRDPLDPGRSVLEDNGFSNLLLQWHMPLKPSSLLCIFHQNPRHFSAKRVMEVR